MSDLTPLRPTEPLVIGPLERYPVSWTVSSTVPLTGDCAVGFTTGADPDAATTFTPCTWADTDPTAEVRVTQAICAGSGAAQPGDANPGVGDYVAFIRYTDLAGMVRIRSGGPVHFR